jgi:hypothetical protein
VRPAADACRRSHPARQRTPARRRRNTLTIGKVRPDLKVKLPASERISAGGARTAAGGTATKLGNPLPEGRHDAPPHGGLRESR